jgi:hypothetical protein
MRAPRLLLDTSIAVLVAIAPAVALATPEFPADIQSDLMLDYTPPCTICHVGVPGPTTATTPFATAMQARGLAPYDDSSLATALQKMESDKVDSDGNGVPDIEQLEAGDDPSTGESLADSGPTTVYGCGAQLAVGATSWQGAAALGTALALGLGLGRRRRAQRTPSPQV